MDTITYSAACASLGAAMDRVCNDHEALIITRDDGPSVVMMSLEGFQALDDTAYLLRNPINAKRLFTAVTKLAKE